MLSRDLYHPEELKYVATRDGYGEGLVEAGKINKNVVVLCADVTESTRAHLFERVFPERFIEVGIAEQNMVGIAAGLALSGKIPFISSYAVFSPGKNWDQIRISVCYSKANVKIAGSHAGLSAGEDSASHQALEDIALMRVLPNMVVIVPCDAIETRKATVAAAKYKGPVYLRFAREETPVFTTEKTPFKIGRAQVLKKGGDITLIGCGPILYEALLAAREIENKISVEVINSHTIKPLDEETILKSVKKTGRVVTVEEHQIAGGLGGAIAEFLGETYPVPLMRVGVQDRFGESGRPQELLKKYGLTKVDIMKAVRKVVEL